MSDHALDHFLRLARAGKHTGCSTGERQARKLALAIIENAPSLDDAAIAGAVEFIKGCPMSPSVAKDLIKG